MRAIFASFRRTRGVLVAAVAGLALAGCATYPGGYGSYPSGSYPSGSYPSGGYGQQQYGNQVVGTVQGVERGYNRIVLTTDGGSYGGRQVALQYDSRTRLYYQGRSYPVEGLERGDVIRAEVVQTSGRLYTRQIEVVRNVREGGGYNPGGGYDPYGGGYGGTGGYDQLRGRVSWNDQRAQVLRIDSGYGQAVDVRYDSRTTVEWRGARYPARDLDPGDVVRIDARRSGSSWFAERIIMEQNAGR